MAKMKEGVRKAHLKKVQSASRGQANLMKFNKKQSGLTDFMKKQKASRGQGVKGLRSSAIYARQSSGSWTHGRKRQFAAATAALQSYFGCPKKSKA
jgi:hypothetical protein